MNSTKKLLTAVTIALACTASVQANDDGAHFQPMPQLQGVWLSQVTIRDCVSGAALAGAFPGVISFQTGGTIGESGPALPNTTRGPGYGVWQRTGRSTFSETLTFQRFDLSGIFLGTQVIHAVPKVANDSRSYVGLGGTFEVKDQHGSTIATGCSSATGVRFQ
jgi:hypothetical protein